MCELLALSLFLRRAIPSPSRNKDRLTSRRIHCPQPLPPAAITGTGSLRILAGSTDIAPRAFEANTGPLGSASPLVTVFVLVSALAAPRPRRRASATREVLWPTAIVVKLDNFACLRGPDFDVNTRTVILGDGGV